MIPYAICRGTMRLKIAQPHTLDIRLLELGSDCASFRLPLDYCGQETQVEELSFRFFLWEKGTTSVVLKQADQDFVIREKSRERFWVEWELETKNPDFIEAARILTEEYLRYIHAKLMLEDHELSCEYNKDYPLDETICTSIQEQKDLFAKTVMEGISGDSWECLPDLKFGISLSSASLRKQYLSHSLRQFTGLYWKEAGLPEHPLAKKTYHFLAVGNAFCPLLQPPLSEMEAIIRKARGEGLELLFELAPVSELAIEETKSYLDQLHRIYMQGNENQNQLEIRVCDAGILSWLSHQSYPGFVITPGILMRKIACDAREKYRHVIPEKAQSETGSDPLIYVPYEQMNTGTFCPLYAAVVNKDRGKQLRVTSCSGLCERYAFLYPKKLEMIGRYNSLFFLNPEHLQKCPKNGLQQNKRLLLNF